MKNTPELSKINLFEHFILVEILVIGGKTHTESNVKSDRKLPFESQKYIISQYLQSQNFEIRVLTYSMLNILGHILTRTQYKIIVILDLL